MRIVPIFITFLLLAASSGRAVDRTDERYYQRLRELGLFTVAESDLHRRLDDEANSVRDRALLTIELSTTHSRHAMHSTGRERDDQWRLARSVVKDLTTRPGSGDWRAIMQAQQAIVTADQAMSLAWLAHLAVDDPAQNKAAIDALRKASDTVRQSTAQLDEAMRLARRSTEDGPRPYEVRDQDRQLQMRFAQMLVALGELTTGDVTAGDRRTATLREARQFTKSLSAGTSSDPLTGESQLLDLRIARLQERSDWAKTLAEPLRERTSAPGLRQRATAELMRVQIIAGRPDEAMQLALDAGRQGIAISQEIAAVQVEALLTAARQAVLNNQSSLADDLRQQAEQLHAQLRGPWSVRTARLLQRLDEMSRFGPELAEKTRQAQSAYGQSKFEEATQLYSEAARLALERGLKDAAAELAYTRASILLQMKEWDSAASAFDDLITHLDDASQVPDASLLRAYALGKLNEANATDERRADYLNALRQHIDTHAGHPTADEARWMLATANEASGELRAAFDGYLELADHEKHGDQALSRLAHISRSLPEQATHDPTAQPHDVASIITRLGDLVATFPPPPDRWTLPQAEVAIALARLQLGDAPARYDAIDQLLSRVISSHAAVTRTAEQEGAPIDPAWSQAQNEASGLRIIALAGGGRLDEAERLIITLAADTEELLDVLTALSRLSDAIPQAQRPQVGRLQLQTAGQLMRQRAGLEPAVLARLDLLHAQALAMTGDRRGAIAAFESLLAKSPKDADLLEQTATLLQDSQATEHIARALTYWRRLEALRRKGTSPWLTARLHVAQCLHRLGREDEVRKLLKVTQLLYPNLGDTEQRAQIDELIN